MNPATKPHAFASGAGRTPLFVLTGFLGSGKTTLLNSLLRHPDFADTAVIVNELGEIGLDHHLIASATDNVVLLASGCLCCALVDSLEETLAELHRRRAAGEIKDYRRVVIETSGLADPGPILNVLLGHRLVTDHHRLAALLCTVDAQQVEARVRRHPEAHRQIVMADRLLLTKTDLVPAEQCARVRAACADLNPQAPCDAVCPGLPSLSAFLEEAPGRPRLFVPLAAVHGTGVGAHGLTLDHDVTWAGIAAWTRLLQDALGDRLLRVKALLRVRDTPGAVFVQGVGGVFHRPERLPAWPDADPRGRIVCIVQNVEVRLLHRSLAALALDAGIDAHVSLEDLPEPPATLEHATASARRD